MNNRNKRSNADCELYRALTTLQTPEEFHRFFLDLCTQAELNAMEPVSYTHLTLPTICSV